MRDEGLCRYIGMTGYPAPVMNAAMTETELDVCLTYAHATLLDDTLEREIAPVADRSGRRPHRRSRGRARPAHAGRLIDQARPPRNPRDPRCGVQDGLAVRRAMASTSPSSPTNTPYSARGALPP